MVILDRYFPHKSSDRKLKVLDLDYDKENDLYNSKLMGAKVKIKFREDNIFSSCSCYEGDCEHVYNTLVSIEKEKVKDYEGYIKDLEKQWEILFKKTYDEEYFNLNPKFRIKKYNTKTINYYKKANVKDYNKYLEALVKINPDYLVNTNEFNLLSFIKNQIKTFIKFQLNPLTSMEETLTVFEILKTFYPYITSSDFIGYSMDEEYLDFINNILLSIKLLISYKGEEKSEINKFIFKLLTISPYNTLILKTHELIDSSFVGDEYSDLKEEISFNKFLLSSDNTIEKEDDEYFKLKRDILINDIREKEYWFNFHLNLLKNLNYSDEEISNFYYHARDYKLGLKGLMEYYKKNNKTEEIVKVINEAIENENNSLEYTKILLKYMRKYTPEYLETNEFKELLRYLVISKEELDYLDEYLSKIDWMEDKEELKDILERHKLKKPILNEIYYKEGNVLKLIESLKKSSIDEFFKYEDFLIDKYPKRAFKLLNKKLLDSPHERFEYDKVIKDVEHLKKYPHFTKNLKNLIENYRRYYRNIEPLINHLSSHFGLIKI